MVKLRKVRWVAKRATLLVGGLMLTAGSVAMAQDNSPVIYSADRLFKSNTPTLTSQIQQIQGEKEAAPKPPTAPAAEGMPTAVAPPAKDAPVEQPAAEAPKVLSTYDAVEVGHGCETGCGDYACETACDSDRHGFMNVLSGGDSGIEVRGWTQIGYHNESTGLFNSHPDRLNLHQQYLSIGRDADGSNGFDIGGRFDIVYGVDAQDTQAFGNPDSKWDNSNGFDHGIYGWAMPQAYVEFAQGNLTTKWGHFYTLIGYEVVTAPDNFFYSHAFTMNNSEPFTHTGGIAEYQATDNITLYGGWTLGWDTGFDKVDNAGNFLGGISVGLNDSVTATYMTTIGDFGLRGDGYMHSIVVDVALSDNLNYVFQSDYLYADTPGGMTDEDYGVNQYLFYTISDELAAGVRAEWWNNDGQDIYGVTVGVNVKPTDNIIIRPEVRWQGGDAPMASETIFGIDAILTY